MEIQKDETGLYVADIDGQKYAFAKWGAEESLDVLLELVPMVSGPIGSAVSAVFGGDKDEAKSILDKELNADAIGMVFKGLTTGFNKKSVKDLIIKLTSRDVLCDGLKISFNRHYQDKLSLMFKVARAALEVQYGNFFADVKGLAGSLGIKKVRPPA
jgi:hypothetical protein